MTAARLRVERFHAEYRVAAAHPAPERVRGRLDAALRRDLPEVLRAVLAPWLGDADESVWIVRRLDVALELNAAWEPRRAARRWAADIARTMTRTLTSQAAGRNAIRFDDRAAYLARFLADLAAGDAWGRWYYGRFRGLKHLPTSAALRTAVCDEPGAGLSALLHLGAGERRRVLGALSAQDTTRVLDALPDGASTGHEEGCWSALAVAAAGPRLRGAPASAESRLALDLYLDVCHADGSLSGPSLRAGVRAVARLVRVLDGASPDRAAEVSNALTAGDAARLYSALGPADAEAVWPLRAAPTGLLESILGASSPPGPKWADREGEQGGDAATAPSHTAFGGFFLLLPFLDRLPLDEAARDWPGPKRAAAVLRLLLAAKCLGRVRSPQVLRDPLVRELLGVPALPVSTAVAPWRRLANEAADRFAASLAGAGGREEAAGGGILALSHASMPGAPVAVLLDARTGRWLWARGYSMGAEARLASGLAVWLDAAGCRPDLMLAEREFVAPLSAVCPGTHVLALGSAAAGELAAGDARLAAVLARLDRLGGDLAYLAVPAELRLRRSIDLALSVAAQRVLRDLAARLPGFAESSLPYLSVNFLDLDAQVEEEPSRWVVRLGRPPLQFVLGSSGLARAQYRPSWSDRPFALFQAGDQP